MNPSWTALELAESWALTPEERAALLSGKTDANRLSIAALLKFFQLEGRFPATLDEVPEQGLAYLAQVVESAAPLAALSDLPPRTYERQRAEVRTFLGVRQATLTDYKRAQQGLLEHALPGAQSEAELSDTLRAWFRRQQLELPSDTQQQRILKSAVHQADTAFAAGVCVQLSRTTTQAIDTLLVAPAADGEDLPQFSALKADPARPSLETVFKELAKLKRIDQLQLPPELFVSTVAKVVHTYRLRAGTESITELRQHPAPIRYTLVAAFCHERRGEIVDGLIELLVQLVNKIHTNAEKKVVQELLSDVRAVHGKSRLLYKLAEAALRNPEGTVKDVLYRVVEEETLEAVVKEYEAKGPAYQRYVQTLVRSSYTGHYRAMVPKILEALTFESNNAQHRPVIEALAYLKGLQGSKQRFLTLGAVPVEAIVPPDLHALVVERDGKGGHRINRIHYEICVLKALRTRLRCKEVWVAGATRYRNPDEDLPRDFVQKRETYYHELHQPLEAETFIQTIHQNMREALRELNRTLPNNEQVSLRLAGKNRIKLSPLEALPEPVRLGQLKGELGRRWPMTGLLDILKEAELRIGFTDVFKGLGNREILDRDILQQRLLLCLYGLGANTGLKRVLSKEQGVTYDELLYVKRRYLHTEALRTAIAEVANAIFRIRQPHIWGEGTTACASDSKKFGAWDQNLLTAWHIRYGGRGVMIYWHVEKNANCIYSQLRRCSASEVAAMMEEVLRHCTEMAIDKQYVDTHGQSEGAFAFCHLLGFNLMPRLKNLAKQKLSLPSLGERDVYPHLAPILTKVINWELIRQQYDELIKFATALKVGTAEPEAILRRFTRDNTPQHPTSRALAELGRAIKTIFLCRYLISEPVRREIHDGLNVVENWNGANSFIFYGKNGEIAANQMAEQELSVLSLHLLQICLVYINTLMIQDVLANRQWFSRMGPEDFRALTPLIYSHINPYGVFRLDMQSRLPLQELAVAA
jgi:TnpA family transposase